MIIDVALPLPLQQTFLYKVSDPWRSRVEIGKRVRISFRGQKKIGIICGTRDQTNLPLLEIEDIVDDTPIFPKSVIELILWTTHYYSAPIGELFRLACPFLDSASFPPKDPPGVTPPSSRGQIPFQLNSEQQTAFDQIRQALKQKDFAPFLLHGVTGSGKTEVYLHAIQDVLNRGEQALFLVPEIALTPQLLEYFMKRFPGLVTVFHSRLTVTEKRAHFLSAFFQQTPIVIGTRSAIFAPLTRLKLIVVDEEHDGSFKQKERSCYNARDLALVRGQIEKGVVILGSATPSIEIFSRSQSKKIFYLSLSKRVENRPLPDTILVDLKAERDSQKGWDSLLSTPLANALEENLRAGEQSILLLNRRGYAPFLLCKDCGFIPRCPACTISLTYYHKMKELRCHYCSYRLDSPAVCGSCQGFEIAPIGFGTERIERAIRELWPQARVQRMDRDSIQRKGELEKVLTSLRERQVDIVIGTQIVAKGHDFPHVTLVGVILAEVSLNLPDFRAAERTFQLLTQVAGRAGRGATPGRVIIQTYNPSHYSLNYATHHDFTGFFNEEIRYREAAFFPPFCRLALWHIIGKKLGDVEIEAGRAHQFLATTIKQLDPTMNLLGPTPAPLQKIKGKFRYLLLLKSPTSQMLTQTMKIWKEKYTSEKKVQIYIDRDPYSLL